MNIADLANYPTLSVEEAAGVLGISTRSAYRAVERGEIPTLKVGRRLRVKTPALLRLLGVDVNERIPA